jgi:hypothetical protein
MVQVFLHVIEVLKRIHQEVIFALYNCIFLKKKFILS